MSEEKLPFTIFLIRQDAPRQILGGKTSFSPCRFALGFHYLFIRQDAPRQILGGKTSFSLAALHSAFTIFS